MKSFDPQSLERRWNGPGAPRDLEHPELDPASSSADLGGAARELIQEIQSELHSVSMIEILGEERREIIHSLADTLATATQKLTQDYHRRVLGEDAEVEPQGDSTGEELIGPSSSSEGASLEPNAEDVEIPDETELDDYHRILNDLEGLLEVYLRYAPRGGSSST